MRRVVLDTNVLVSAVISDGKPRELLRKGISKKYRIVTSDSILKELVTVLHRPKFKTNEDEIHRIVLALLQTAEVVDVISKFNLVKEDPKDDIFIATAYDGRADFISTGDNHLLALKKFKDIEIVSVKQMLKRLEEENTQ